MDKIWLKSSQILANQEKALKLVTIENTEWDTKIDFSKTDSINEKRFYDVKSTNSYRLWVNVEDLHIVTIDGLVSYAFVHNDRRCKVNWHTCYDSSYLKFRGVFDFFAIVNDCN